MNIQFLIRLKPPKERDQGRMKKIRGNRGDEPSWVITHTYMEISQENSLFSYLYFKPAKHVFLSFFFILQNQRTGKMNKSYLWCVIPVGRARERNGVGG
jgi:hypothetical protein